MNPEIKLGNIMIDCSDERLLQQFYSKLLNWEQCMLYGKPAVKNSDGIVLLFSQIPNYVPPVWPEKRNKQQKQMHFDFQVENLDEYVDKAKSLGAQLAEEQYGGQNYITMIDPAGHPFCLCKLN